MNRRTKIVCTIGPASQGPERIRGLLDAGMDVARLNFSHGNHASHREQYEILRAVAAETRVNLAIMMDLQGPKIRTGRMRDGAELGLAEGEEITITTRDVPGDAACVSTTYQHLPYDVAPGDRILIADGIIELRVRETAPPDVRCEVVRGGLLGQNKGINLPGVQIAESSLTEKDKEDLCFGLALGVDYVALSFVRRPDDLREIRAIVSDSNTGPGIIAKIERPEALDCLDEILDLSDAIMVARGDLGVEMPFQEVPVLQKHVIRRCNERGVPVITATQMLESMVDHARPTRAEVTDVANAIFDGTDAVMLSGETASGRYPLEACDVMAKVALEADQEMARSRPESRRAWVIQGQTTNFFSLPSATRRREEIRSLSPNYQESYADAIGLAVSQIADTLQIRHIVCFTTSGYTAAAISRYRPAAPVTAITNSERTQRRCALMWGVSAFKTGDVASFDEMVRCADRLMQAEGRARPGDTVILVAGTPLAVAGRTNLLKLHTIGE